MAVDPSSHFVNLPDRPIVQSNGQTVQDSLKLHYWEWKGRQPTILFCHAASFHGRCYDRIIEEALQGFHVIALDFRGHGRSQQHPPPYHVRWLGEDVSQFIETLELPTDNLIGIGHSMGGYALTYAAAIAPTRLFRSLLLLDPSIVFPSYYGIGDQEHELLEPFRHRKSWWFSVDEMISRLVKREPFSRWPSDTLRSYCTYALDENNKLTCSPDVEHSLYHSHLQTESNIYPLIEQSKFIHEIPIHLVRTSIPFRVGQLDSSPTSPDLINWFKKGRDTQISDATHLFPMEQPQLAVGFIKDMIKQHLRSRL